ncbi:MAG: response regulator transcription factor [Anaerolineae bacterium]|nr:response regulator transcription factor [Anaerolineae bacterium]
MTDLRVLVIADNLLARAGLSALLAEQPAVRVVGQVAAGNALMDDIDVYRPDVLIWDFGWEPRSALERLAEVVDELESDILPPLLILLPDDDHAPETAALLRSARVGGLLLRDSNPDQLGAALATVGHGLLVFDPALAVLPSTDLLPEPLVGQLTAREQEVLQLLAEGLPNKIIAQRLGISDHTVKFHVNAIMGKLNAQSRTEAVVRATRLGLIML